jgi:SAM-dependent methyltransferase
MNVTTRPSDGTLRPCPACHSERRKEIGVKNGFQIFQCKCRSLYTGTLADDESVEDYDSYYSEENLTTPPFIRSRLKEIIGGFQPFYKTGALLDVGFGAADLLCVARDLGWNVSGVEVSAPAIEHARGLGLEVRHSDLIAANYPDDHFDVVTASEIIEHCDEPEELLNEVYRILRPGGLFWATTPAAGGLSYRLMGLSWTTLSPPEHMQLFSRRATYGFLSRFSSVKVLTHAFNPSEVIAHFRNRDPSSFDRVSAGYSINEQLSSSRPKKLVKIILNGTLNVLGIGDSLKIFAIK